MTPILKLHIKSLIATMLYLSGLLHLIAFFRLRNRAVVLMYHRILNEEDMAATPTTSGIIVSKKTFQKHVKFLTRYFNIIDYEAFSNSIKNHTPFRNKTCLITFDDGWYDNFTTALPILKSHNCPALIFLPTNYIGTGEQFWQEKLTSLLKTAVDNIPATNNLLDSIKYTSKIHGTAIDKKDTISLFVSSLKEQSENNIRKIISDIASQLKKLSISLPENTNDKFINWKQAKQMNKSGFTIGSHAVSHRLLDRLSEDELEFELVKSKELLEEKLSTTISTIAYPNGNHSETTKSATRNAGYKTGFSTNPGYVTNNSDFYSINRINMHEMATYSNPLLLSRILGIF